MTTCHLATATQDGLANEITTLLDAGASFATIKFYDGTIPANANTAISTQNLLCTITLPKPSFGASSSGTITLNGVPLQNNAVATGTCTWARVASSTPNTVIDVDVGTASASIIINTTSIVSGGPVVISSGTVTMPTG